MNEMIKKVREDKKGFTLAELLIVVAIILVLVAVAIPVFMGAQDSSKLAVATADIRAVKAEASTDYLLKGYSGDYTYKTTVDKQGNIGALTSTKKATGDTTTEPAGIKDSIGGEKPVDITVVVTATDLSKK